MSNTIQPGYGMNALAGLYNLAGVSTRNSGISFMDLASVTAAGAAATQNVAGMSFEEMCQARFPGAYYHVMDASKIPQSVWERNDFPFEKFFADKVDESVLDWTPTGAEPAMDSSQVQARFNSILGQTSIVVPPELEEKMKNDPALANKVMANIDYLFAWNGYPIPGRENSALIVLDENGEVARWRLTSGGGLTGPTEEEQRQFEAEQKAKQKRREENTRLAEESALKRRLQEQEATAIALQHKIVSITGHKELSAPRLTSIPTEAILAITQSQVWGSGAIL